MNPVIAHKTKTIQKVIIPQNLKIKIKNDIGTIHVMIEDNHVEIINEIRRYCSTIEHLSIPSLHIGFTKHLLQGS